MSALSPALRPGTLGLGLRAGVALYATLLVAIPLLSLIVLGLSEGPGAFLDAVRAPVASAALGLTLWTGALVGVLNTLLGSATAWVLVRERFPGRALLSAVIDLPLAIPTLVAGVMLAILCGPGSVIGERVSAMGVEIVFAPPGIVLALLFVTLPFVVRAVEPVLAELDRAEEEAAIVLGAGPLRTFWTVSLPAILPAAISGGVRSLARALGEFGSVVVIAGNIPFRTLTAPVYVFGEIESGAPRAAAAVSVVLLAFALCLHACARLVEQRTGARHASR